MGPEVGAASRRAGAAAAAASRPTARSPPATKSNGYGAPGGLPMRRCPPGPMPDCRLERVPSAEADHARPQDGGRVVERRAGVRVEVRDDGGVEQVEAVHVDLQPLALPDVEE